MALAEGETRYMFCTACGEPCDVAAEVKPRTKISAVRKPTGERALMLALCTLINPGDEVIVFDPWFVMYRHLTTLAGGNVVQVSTYPDFRIRVEDVRKAITPRTKVILFNSPANPTGAVASAREVQALAELAAEKNIALISDEIYRVFCYDEAFHSPAEWNDRTIVIDGFSKSHSMTGLRLGYIHGPQDVIQQMLKLQQFTFVCAPHPVQRQVSQRGKSMCRTMFRTIIASENCL